MEIDMTGGRWTGFRSGRSRSGAPIPRPRHRQPGVGPDGAAYGDQGRRPSAEGRAVLDRRLYLHLATWLGQWPAGPGQHVVGSWRRAARPGTAASARPSRSGSTAVRCSPCRRDGSRPSGRSPRTRSALYEALPAAVGQPGWAVHDDVFRWCLAPAALPDVGGWTTPPDPAFPPWLRLFDSEVLVVRDADGGYLAGVGIKRHDAYGHELAVGTVPARAAGGWPAGSVAQAARRVLDEGAVPTYRHDPATPVPPGSPRRPASRTGAGRRTASTRADRPGWRSGGARTVDPGPDPRSATSPGPAVTGITGRPSALVTLCTLLCTGQGCPAR